MYLSGGKNFLPLESYIETKISGKLLTTELYISKLITNAKHSCGKHKFKQASKRSNSQHKHLQSYCTIYLCSLWPGHVFSSVACCSISRPTSCVHPLVDRHLDSRHQTLIICASHIMYEGLKHTQDKQ